MQVRPLSLEGSWEILTQLSTDERGTFVEWFKASAFADMAGHSLSLEQANCSVSAAGVLRGIHFAEVPPGQAKYVACMAGAVLDVVVDIRVGSPTYGQWDSVLLDDKARRAVYVSEGLGHAFLSLADHSTVVYLCSAPYAPSREHRIHPLDPQLAIQWPATDRAGRALTPRLAAKDAAAPSLAEVMAAGLLPDYAQTAQLHHVTRTMRQSPQ